VGTIDLQGPRSSGPTVPPLERQLYTLVKILEEFIYQLKTNRKWDLTRWKNILLYTDKKNGTKKNHHVDFKILYLKFTLN